MKVDRFLARPGSGLNTTCFFLEYKVSALWQDSRMWGWVRLEDLGSIRRVVTFLFDQTEEDSAATELTTQPNSYPLTHYFVWW